MRLTKKDITYITSGANVIEIPDIIEGHKYTGQAIIKLGQLEDIEDNLMLDLITFHKLMNIIYCGESDICFIKEDDKIIQAKILELDYCKKKVALIVNADEVVYGFHEYGKTWSLTKEELL